MDALESIMTPMFHAEVVGLMSCPPIWSIGTSLGSATDLVDIIRNSVLSSFILSWCFAIQSFTDASTTLHLTDGVVRSMGPQQSIVVCRLRRDGRRCPVGEEMAQGCSIDGNRIGP